MKRKALDKLESIAKRDIRPPKTIKDLPLELIHKISKYGDVPFIPSKDTGPLAPTNIDMLVHLRDTQDPSHGQLTQSMLSSKSVLRRSEQGPFTAQQTYNEKMKYTKTKMAQLRREQKLVEAIFGPNHPITINVTDKYWDTQYEDMMNVRSFGSQNEHREWEIQG